MARRVCFRVLIGVLLPAMVAMAERYRFRNYGPDDGLNTAVSVILQDRTGFLWVGTGNGLFRYDGAHFQRFGLEEGLPSSSIRCLLETQDGTLWVATGAGLARLRQNRFQPVDLGVQKTSLDLHAIAEGNGKIYVGVDQGLLAATLEADSPVVFHLEPGTPVEPVWGVFVDAGGAVWFSSGMHLSRLDRSGLRVFDEKTGLPSQRWGAMLRDQQGNLWVRGPQRLFMLPSGEQRFEARDQGLPQSSNTILALEQDRRGTIMVATDQGLGRWIEGKWQLTGTAQGLESDSVTSVFEDREGSIWIGMWGAGLARWPGSGQWTNWTIEDGLSSNVIWAIRRDPTGAVWVGTDHGLLRMDSGVVGRVWTHKDGLGGDKVKSLVIASDGAVWAACLPGGVSRLDPVTGRIRTYGKESGLEDDRVVAIHLDPENRLWASTGEGLYRSDGLGTSLRFQRQEMPGSLKRTAYYRFLADRSGGLWVGSTQGLFHWTAGRNGGQWRRFTTSDGLKSNAVTHMAETGDGALWIAYRDPVGLSRLTFAGRKTEVQHVAGKAALPSDYILFLGLDSGGRLWAGTDNGVAVKETTGWTAHTHEDGLVWDDCAANAFLADPGGAVWIGTLKGLSRYQPGPPGPSLTPPRPVILDVNFGEGNLSAHSTDPGVFASVPFRDRDFSVSFSSLSFQTEKNMRFRYRLTGLDDRWVETAMREVHYASLPAGSYRFEVAARNANSEWSGSSQAVAFRIVPPWWATWWFLLLTIGGLVALVCLVVRARVNQMIRERRRLERAVLDRTKDLELQKDVVQRQKGAIEELLRQSEEISRLKSEFLANMSHEIRTPMNGVIGMTQLMLGTSLDREQTEYITTVRDSAEALLVVINDILDFSKIEAGKMELVYDSFSVRECVSDALQVFVWKAREKGIGLAQEIAPEVPEMVMGDSDRLRQVLLNLVANAMKFTEQGKISLTVTALERANPETWCLQFSVRDTGAGIPLDRQEAIFEAFEQADGSSTRRTGGTGLGLAICSKLVRLMHGRIGVVSAPGQGSTFSFSIQLGVDSGRHSGPGKDRPQRSHEYVVPKAAEPLRILLAEDNVVNQLVARRLIEKMGHALVVVEDGRQAVKAALEGKFDLVFMDVQMPEMDGFEAVALIRQAESERSCPTGQEPPHLQVIAMTAHAMSGDRDQCLRAGMDDYISKPISVRAVTEAIERVCEMKMETSRKS